MNDSKLEEVVALDNIRTHQIGGETDGITREEAEKLGFTSPNPETTEKIQRILANRVGSLPTGSEVAVENLPAAKPVGHNLLPSISPEDRKKVQADAAIGLEESRRRLRGKDGE